MADHPNRNKLSGVLSGKYTEYFAEMQAEDTPYFSALGRFVSAYAQAEAGVHAVARHLSGMKITYAAVIFGQMTLPQLTSCIRLFLEVPSQEHGTGIPAVARHLDIESCLAQINIIALERHKVVHRPASWAGDVLTFSNILTAKKTFEQTSFGISDLNKMRIDCIAIYLRLFWVVHPDQRDAGLLEFVHAPWR